MILSRRRIGLAMCLGLLLLGPMAGHSLAQDRESPRLLEPEQINVIKVWELPTDLDDMQVSVRIPRAIMLEVFDRYRSEPEVPKGRAEQQAFLRRPASEQLELLFNLAPAHPGIRAYYQDVQVNGEPASMIEFRRRVYGNYIQRYFRRYFGGGEVPQVTLVSAAGNSLVEMYTNFYILHMAEVNGRRMIDRGSPEDSLLLQWGLPREAARFPAPDVSGWRPMFRGVDDPNFVRMAETLGMLYDSPDYGIDYPLPGGDDEPDEREQ